ncbi:MAG: hypoxanthine phosphoribosyltransferase [Bacillota bacterium]
MDNRLHVVLSSEQIAAKVKMLGEAISLDYLDRELVLISVLRGGVYFAVDLSRCLTIPFTLDFISISRYGEPPDSFGAVRIVKDLDVSITGKHTLIIEDIIDTGLSLSYLLRNLKTRGPASLKVCTLLNVEARRIVDVPVDYKGFDLPNIFVVGYGLDYNEAYRNLEYIAEFTRT